MATATAVYSGHAASQMALDQLQSPGEEQYFSTFFCRALYDYQTDDDSSLSFRQDDIIEVLTKLDSGWWDGLLGQERGWFPSNYVAVMSDQEADALFAAEADAAPTLSQSTSEYGSIDMTPDITTTSPQQSLNQELRNENFLPVQDARNGRAPHQEPTLSNDFWVPQVSMDGRVRVLFAFLLNAYESTDCCDRYTT